MFHDVTTDFMYPLSKSEVVVKRSGRSSYLTALRRRGPWRTLEAVEFATLEWIDWFNNRSLLEPIGNILPAEAEARYYAQAEDIAMLAWLNKPASAKPGAVQ